jgi:hypothetical protein
LDWRCHHECIGEWRFLFVARDYSLPVLLAWRSFQLFLSNFKLSCAPFLNNPKHQGPACIGMGHSRGCSFGKQLSIFQRL